MNLSARNLVSRNIPQRSIVSRIVPQRSVVSRIQPGHDCGCSGSCGGCHGLSDGDSYEWGDILDKWLTVKKTVTVYDLPSYSSATVGTLHPGDKIMIYSYVNVNGRTWFMFYPDSVSYHTSNPSYIPASGTPASTTTIPVDTMNTVFDPKSDDPNILTTTEQQNQNLNFWQNAENLAAKVMIYGGALALLSTFIRRKQ